MKLSHITPMILVAVAGGVAAPAAAQTEGDFTGPRIEILGGYDSLRSGSDVDVETDNAGPDESVDGFAYGIGAGYDFDLGSAVVGIEAEYMDSTGEEDNNENVNAPFGYNINLNRDLYIGARVGAKVTPKTLLYAKGGYTNTRVESRFQDNLEDDGVDFTFDDGQTIDGYRLGAGVEHQVGKGFVKLEYRYSNYSALQFDDEIFNDDAIETDIDLDRHQVVAGVGVRF